MDSDTFHTVLEQHLREAGCREDGKIRDEALAVASITEVIVRKAEQIRGVPVASMVAKTENGLEGSSPSLDDIPAFGQRKDLQLNTAREGLYPYLGLIAVTVADKEAHLGIVA
ncbi:hypothetical protein [Paenibacillus sp. RC67]|uniref:hypothetical protein n=1 Tax=Paenibacillus sp. RC67 TaxID=3039392 RepID=UPI0024AE8335|nr:hypothetical protein [Paenibacillus sp. RC67]